MNKAILTGRLTKDPEMKQTATGTAVANFTIACKKDYKVKEGEMDADFINIVVWGKSAEFVTNYFKKGSGIELSGRISTRSYDNTEGKKVYVTEVVADTVNFGAGATKGEGGGSFTPKATASKPEDGFFIASDDDELPF